jgi:branched-chain amino acid transport system substrate-binding protein
LCFGPYGSGQVRAVAPVAARHGQVLWNHGGSADDLFRGGSPWLVSVVTPASRYFAGVLAYAQHLDPAPRRLALFEARRSPFAAAVVEGAAREALARGWEIVYHARYPPHLDRRGGVQTHPYRPWLEQARAAAPDLLLGAGAFEDDRLLARELLDAGVALRLVGLVAVPLVRFHEALADAGERLALFVGPSQWEPEVPYVPDLGPAPGEIAAAYRARWGEEPDYPAAQAYAAGLIAACCVARAGTLDPAELRAAAAALRITTFFGPFAIDPATGAQTAHQMLVVAWQRGRKHILWPRSTQRAGME